MVTNFFHMLRVHASQILALKFPSRPNFAYLVNWGASHPISWSAQCTPVTRELHPTDTGTHPGDILDPDRGSEEGCPNGRANAN